MADTFLVSGSRVQKWEKKFLMEYQRALQFKELMRADDNAPIQINTSLVGKPGEVVNIPLITLLSGAGVTGNTTLEGSEESLDNYNDALTVEWRRHGVLVTKREESVTEIDVRDAAKQALKLWSISKLRDDILATLQSPVTGFATAYADASEANKDSWLAANSDRVLFGNATSNNASNDHSAALTQCDATNDTLTVANLRFAKRVLKAASPAIRPIQVDGQGEWYVMLCPSDSFRDLKASMDQIHRESGVRGKNNPLYVDGDMCLDGIIIKEVPELATIADVGDGGTVDVAPNFILGAQAVTVAYKQMPKLVVDPNRDYNFRYGVAIEEALIARKLEQNSVQHGVFTYYTAAEPDA